MSDAARPERPPHLERLAAEGRKVFGLRHTTSASDQIDIANAATVMTERITGTKAPEPRMDVRLVADAVLYMANLPLDANVLFMTVMATKMPFVARG